MSSESNNKSQKNKNTQSSKAGDKNNKKKWIIENVVSLGLALFLVLIIRSSVIEAFKIPSGSMIPTLLVGDYIFVNKFSYGLKIPFTEWVLDEPAYAYKSDPPKRGHIVVFKYPRDPSIYYIKRVVGVPGDVIEVRDKVVYVNNQPITRSPLDSKKEADIRKLIDENKYAKDYLKISREKPQNKDDETYVMMVDDSQYMSSNFGPVQVPTGEYFVMGDNRDHSHDSRIWGFVPFSYIKGRAFVVWLSLWLDFGEKEFIFRPTRTGTLLE